jgi:DNA-directed RNA polymerase specialized sigma24 family protein
MEALTTAEVFKRGLRELDGDNRRVLELRYERAMSNEGIANVMSLTLAEVAGKMSRARRLLFQKLENMESPF